METLKVEGIEGLNVEAENEEVKPSLEYQKLLLEERNRSLGEKARNLVKFGCFSQKQETKVDFAKYEKILQNKKFKGTYDLYLDLKTMELVFIAPLVENKEGEAAKAPYAYDLIITEAMDDESYKQVCHAAKNNLRTVAGVLHKASFIAYFAYAAVEIYLFIYHLVTSTSTSILDVIAGAFYATSAHIAALVLIIPVLLIAHILYKNYQEK